MGVLGVGLVGAGPWATRFWAPAVEGADGTELAAVWARRPRAALDVVGGDRTRVAGSFDELLERCDAVAFAVPPDVQAPLASTAARAGRHVLLEKPLALDLAAAEELGRAVGESGVASVMGCATGSIPPSTSSPRGPAMRAGGVPSCGG